MTTTATDTNEIITRVWTTPTLLLAPASAGGTEYRQVCRDELIAFRYDMHGTPRIVERRAATLLEIGTPWADTYIGHPDKPCGTLTDRNWGAQVYVGNLTRAEFRAVCRAR